MSTRWTEWKSFPDAFHGEHIQAPVGPGVYEVCEASTRAPVAFGSAPNVARTLSDVLMRRKIRGPSLFRWKRANKGPTTVEYRAWPTNTLADARIAVSQILDQRGRMIRRFT